MHFSRVSERFHWSSQKQNKTKATKWNQTPRTLQCQPWSCPCSSYVTKRTPSTPFTSIQVSLLEPQAVDLLQGFLLHTLRAQAVSSELACDLSNPLTWSKGSQAQGRIGGLLSFRQETVVSAETWWSSDAGRWAGCWPTLHFRKVTFLTFKVKGTHAAWGETLKHLWICH